MSATITEPFDAAAASAAYRSALDVIGAVEPTVAAAIRQELTDQRESLKLIASENYAVPGDVADDGYVAVGQVRRGHDRSPVLRRMPEHRHRRAGGRRPRQGVVRCAARVRPAALGHRRQPGRVLVDPRPARRGAGARRVGGVARQRPVRRRLGAAPPSPWATSGRWACRSTPAATSPTASARTSAARCSTSRRTAPIPTPACSTTPPCRPGRGSSARWC